MDREQFRDGWGVVPPLGMYFFLSRQEEGEDGSVVGPASLAAGVIRALGIPDEMPTPLFFLNFCTHCWNMKKGPDASSQIVKGGPGSKKVFLVSLLVGFCVQNVGKNS